MKFNIAAKFGLLAALVSLATTGIVGLWSLGQARRVLTDHELVDLTDETELRVFELMNDFRYLRKEVRELANPPSRGDESKVKTADWVADVVAAIDNPDPALKTKADGALRLLTAEFRKLLEKDENDFYLELSCVRVRPDRQGTERHPPLLAVGRHRNREKVRVLLSDPSARPAEELLTLLQEHSLTELLHDAGSTRTSRQQMFPVQAHSVPAATAGDGVTPMLLTVAFPIGKDNSGFPPAMLLLTVDFEQFIRFRARFLPRHLIYLTDDAGRLLLHPDRERQKQLRLDSSRGLDRLPTVRDEPALEPFAKHFAKRTSSQQQAFRKERGDARNDVLLDDVAFSYAMQRLDSSADRARMEKHWEILGDKLLDLSEQHHGLRFFLPSAASGTLEISHPDAGVLTRVQSEVLAWQKEQGWNAPNWMAPVRCEHFALRFMLLNPDLDIRDSLRVAPKEKEETPRFFGLALAAGREEIEHDIKLAMSGMYWAILGLGVGAAAVAWGFSRLLTRPLQRIIRATESIAASGISTEPAVPLPVHARDEIGVLARSFENMRDQLKKRREALYETIARMKAILDTAAEGIVIFDDHGQIESFNQAAEQLFGYQAQEIHGQKIDTLMATSLPASGSKLVPGASDSVRMVARVVRTRGEIEGRRKDGSTFPVEVAFSEVPLQGRTVVTGIFRDITERKKAEREVRRANEELDARVRLRTFELEETMAKLEAALQGAMEATKAKDAFMASMSHELRTPLTTIIGYSEELQEDFEGEGLHVHAGIILGAARHLLDLINDILDFAKIAAGQMKLNLEEFEVSPRLEIIHALARMLATKYENELVFEVAPDLGKMRADEKRVKQILLNLISNACKFTDKGRVTVRAWRETKEEGDRIIFQVRDSGIGMTPDQSRRLGELFYQADQSNTRQKGGTGLGMAITKTFTAMMNGTFEVASELGKGSTFTVRLPARVELLEPDEPAQEVAALPAVERAAGESRNLVLVVDDDQTVRDLLERFLIKEGLEVHTTGSGARVMELARKLRPVAITLDVLMPELDGWTLLAALKTDPTTADIPVIMLTIEDNPKRGFTLGASDYLTKPIDWPRLAAVLHKYCQAAGSAPVLVVEDSLENRELVCRMLQREGRAVVAAENGRIALEKLNAGLKPALILLDLMMPEMDGFQFLEEVRRRRELAGVPIVVVTAKDLTEADRKRLNGSVTQVLSKGSFTPEQLLDYLRGQVQQHARPGT